MFENLSESIERSLKTLKGQGKITEINVASTMKEVLRSLTAADVNYKVAKQFIDEVKKKALGQNVLTAVKPGEMMVKIIHDELTALMGGETAKLNTNGNPAIILMSGLQGSGKTTFSGKIAKKLKTEKNKRPLLVAADVYRPAAIDQLKVLGESIDVPVYTEPGNNNPVEIAQNAIREAKSKQYDLVIIDTAGRLAIDEQMMTEIENIKKAVKPQETLFVVDSMTGQDAVNTARTFNERLNFDGVILTKLDGDARGGAALSIRRVVDKPIKFIGTGEKLDAIEEFHPDRMAGRILGMGDIVSLVEKVESIADKEKAEKLRRKLVKNQFDYNDFLDQIRQIEKMGDIKQVAALIPGVGNAIKDVEIPENPFKGVVAIINSMTPAERELQVPLIESRKRRISKGAGMSSVEVNRVIKQFEQMRKAMHGVAKMSPLQMMKQARKMKQQMGGMR